MIRYLVIANATDSRRERFLLDPDDRRDYGAEILKVLGRKGSKVASGFSPMVTIPVDTGSILINLDNVMAIWVEEEGDDRPVPMPNTVESLDLERSW